MKCFGGLLEQAFSCLKNSYHCILGIIRGFVFSVLKSHFNKILLWAKSRIIVLKCNFLRELLKPSASVALHKHSNALVDILPPEADSSIAMLQAHEKPDIAYSG